jgi:hypothetical protein
MHAGKAAHEVVDTARVPAVCGSLRFYNLIPVYTHTSAYVSIRQHTSAVCGSLRFYNLIPVHTHTSAYVNIRQHTRHAMISII